MGTDPSGLAEKYHSNGHHYVPWELYRDFTDDIKAIFDAEGGRISDKYYHFHDYHEYGGIKHTAYNAIVKQEMEQFLNGKAMTPNLARKFLDETKNGQNEVIKTFNGAVKLERDAAARAGSAKYAELKKAGNVDNIFEEARKAAREEGLHVRASLNAQAYKAGVAYKIMDKKVIRYGVNITKRTFFGVLSYGTAATLVVKGEYSAAANEALLGSSPIGVSALGADALGEFYQYAQDEIQRAANATPRFIDGGKGQNDTKGNRQIIVPNHGSLRALPLDGRQNWKLRE